MAEVDDIVEVEERVCCESSEESARSGMLEMVCGHTARRLERGNAKAGHQPGMTWNADHRAKRFLREEVPIVDDRLDETAPGFGVRAEFPVLVGKIAMQQHGSAVIKRVSERKFAMDPSRP